MLAARELFIKQIIVFDTVPKSARTRQLMRAIMLRAPAIAVFAIVLAVTLLSGPFSAVAQSGKCEAYCTNKRCAPGNVSFNRTTCISRCLAACQAKSK
jgi:hypothetical protein